MAPLIIDDSNSKPPSPRFPAHPWVQNPQKGFGASPVSVFTTYEQSLMGRCRICGPMQPAFRPQRLYADGSSIWPSGTHRPQHILAEGGCDTQPTPMPVRPLKYPNLSIYLFANSILWLWPRRQWPTAPACKKRIFSCPDHPPGCRWHTASCYLMR